MNNKHPQSFFYHSSCKKLPHTRRHLARKYYSKVSSSFSSWGPRLALEQAMYNYPSHLVHMVFHNTGEVIMFGCIVEHNEFGHLVDYKDVAQVDRL